MRQTQASEIIQFSISTIQLLIWFEKNKKPLS